MLNLYIGPMFAKWRWPLDDATLQIKVKWIMSRPIHTISPQTPLAAIMSRYVPVSRASFACCRSTGKNGLLWCLPDKLIHKNKRHWYYSVSIMGIFLRPIIYGLLSGKDT